MDNTEKLEGQRNLVLVSAAISFLVWQGATLGLDVVDKLPDLAPATLFPLRMALIAGAVAWAASMLFLLVFMRRVKRAGAQSVMRDELFLRNRALATMYGYVGMIAAAALLLAVATFIEFSAMIAIRAILIAGVFTPLIALALLGRETVGPG
jgi:predicted lysophospholipase L1 biosynthesis ABC-type transport system permease subunit